MSASSSPVLQQLNSLEKSSHDFHDQLHSVLYGNEYVQCVPNLQGDDLAWLVDYLNEALGALDPSSTASRKCLCELRSICGTKAILPTSYTIPSHLLTKDLDPYAQGGYGDVYKGTLDGSKVCIKHVRVYTREKDEGIKSFYKEAVTWKRLTHPNILHLLGITTTPFQLVSNWMIDGDLPRYIEKNSNAERLGLLCDVAKGLCYLHLCNVIHGDLKGANILVDDSGHARIADFGLATVTQNLDSMRSISLQRGHTLRWTAPEVLNGGKYSKEADIFAFAMVMIEVFTGAVPFGDTTSVTAMVQLLQYECPPRPAHPALTDGLWSLMRCCWNRDSGSRPEAPKVLQILTLSVCELFINQSFATQERIRLITTENNQVLMVGRVESIRLVTTLFSDNDQAKVAGRVSCDNAQIIINVIDEVLDDLVPETRRRCLRFLYKICGRQVLLPQSITIPLCYNPAENPLCRGEFADVWKGQHQGRDVAAKVLRVCTIDNLGKIKRRFCKEVIAWRGLHHPNILPLLGVTIIRNRFVMVSEWMVSGNIREFVNKGTDVNRLKLLVDVTKGMIYMHEQGIIHGNLRGSNILIDNNGHACLADFGLLRVLSDEPTITSTAGVATRAQWMSPELLLPNNFGPTDGRPTKESDCYALGMTIYEVLSGQSPFAQYSSLAVVCVILGGERPGRPKGAQGELFTDSIWRLLDLCWKPQPSDRVSAKTILLGLEGKPWSSTPPSNVHGDIETEIGYQSDAASIDSRDNELQNTLQTGNPVGG